MTGWIWLDGRFVPVRRAAMAATDPAVLYGYGLFEVVRAYRGVPFRLADHLERMDRSARAWRLRVPAGARTVDRAIRELCRRHRTPEAYVRITLTGGGRLFVFTQPIQLPPRAWYRLGAHVETARWTRDPAGPLVGHKTLNYLENVWTHREARRRGIAEVLFLTPSGHVLEGCVSNLFIVRRGALVTPALDGRILPGVTRSVVLELARADRISLRERPVPVRDLLRADEAFLTGTLKEIVPVVRVDGRKIGNGRPGPVTRRLAEAYRGLIASEARP